MLTAETISIFGEALQEKHIGTIGYLPEERGLYKKLKVVSNSSIWRN